MITDTAFPTFRAFLSQFPGFTPESFDLVRPYIVEKKVEAGGYLLRQGQTCRQIAFIVNGLFRISYLHDGKEVTTCFCKEKTITCSYQSLITQEPSETSIQAVEDSHVLAMSYEVLQTLYTKDPYWQQLGRVAAEGEYLVTAEHHRFINDLSATERYLHILKNDKELLQRVPLSYLASYIQVSPETLSRIRKKTARD